MSSDSGIGLSGDVAGGVADEVAAASGDLAAGAQVAGYRLGEQVGWGGMAAVYRAYDVRLGRWVALKILAPEIASDISFRQRFIRESRAAAAVDHPHIIPVYEAGEAHGVLFIAMRYVGGGDIGTLVRRLGRLDASRTCSVISQVGSALDAAHAAGLVHRDVKPANVLLAAAAGGGYPDHVYLSDFGLSKVLSATGPTITGQSLGTLDYMAPEQIEALPVDGRADLYALACTAYEMLAGRPPFRREEDFAALLAQLEDRPPPLTLLRPDLPPAIDRVLVRALARSPADRHETCLDFAVSLLHACGLDIPAGVGHRLDIPAGVRRRADNPAGARRRADNPAGVHDEAAELAWSPAPAETGLAVLARAMDKADEPGQDGPGPERHRPAGPGPGRPATRGRVPMITAVVLVVMLAIAGAAFVSLRGIWASHSSHAGQVLPSIATRPASPGAGGPTRASGGPVSRGSPGMARTAKRGSRPRPGGPAATVFAYIAAINKHHYTRAWRLGGRNSSATYTAFVQGFGTTSKDTLIILSVTGDVVSVELVAEQTDGSVKTYQGTYTVDGGVITESDIGQVS